MLHTTICVKAQGKIASTFRNRTVSSTVLLCTFIHINLSTIPQILLVAFPGPAFMYSGAFRTGGAVPWNKEDIILILEENYHSLLHSWSEKDVSYWYILKY